MKAVIYALRSFGRELRSGEVIVLLAAVALAVAALTAVGFLTDRIGRAVARQANEVLAADLRLRSPDPIPAEWHDMAADYGLRSAETQTFPSVVFAGNLSSLATIKGVSEGYPLRGDVRVSDSLFGEQRIAEGIPDSGSVWADGALMARLDVSVGDYYFGRRVGVANCCGVEIPAGSVNRFCIACSIGGRRYQGLASYRVGQRG